MREFKYGVGVIATIFLLNLLLVKLSEKSSTKTDFRGKNQKDMSHDGTKNREILCFPFVERQRVSTKEVCQGYDILTKNQANCISSCFECG